MKMTIALLAWMLAGPMADAVAAPCPCTNFFTGDAKPFIAEGIARDAASGRFFVAGVAARRIAAIKNGDAHDFISLPDDYSPFGIMVSGRSLWVTAAVVQQGAGHDGPSALLDFDLRNGRLKGTYPVPDAGQHVLNDLTAAPDGTIYASDALDGSLYRLAPGAQTLTHLGKPGLLKSPQGMAVSADGKSLLVADYSLALVKVDLTSGEFVSLQAPDGVNAKGIDGLMRLADGRFLASQNGLRNPRIVTLTLAPDWSQLVTLDVVAADDALVADPSLVAADASGAYLVGVSQWGSFGQNNQTPTKPLQPWRIVKLDIIPRRPASGGEQDKYPRADASKTNK